MSEMPWIVLVCVLLVAATPSVAVTVLLWRMTVTWREALMSTATLLERSMDLLAARTPDDFVRTQTARSISPLYSPSESPEAPARSTDSDAYQDLLNEGVPDDVAELYVD